MPQIVNNLYVTNSNSAAEAQTCTFEISSPAWAFSYKCCEVENGILTKGGDYAFTLTFGNMGECLGRSFVIDRLSVDDIGGVQLKIMDVCGNCNGYIPFFVGLFYYPAQDNYIYWFFTLDQILEYNLELVLCPYFNMYVFLFDDVNDTFYIPLEPHTINCLGILFQVEDIFCDNCPVFSGLQDGKEIVALTEADLKLPSRELDVKLKELKEKYNQKFEQMK